MKQTKTQPYSRYSLDAAKLMGSLIKIAHKGRKLTTQNIAERAGIFRGLVQRIEKGDMKCSIGAVFDVEETTLSKHIRHTTRVIDDDF